MKKITKFRHTRRISIYRDDATTPVIYENVKHVWYEAGNSILVVSQYQNDYNGEHNYFHWPVSRFQWYKDEKTLQEVRL